MKLTRFKIAILRALSTVPAGYSQRIDGLRCETGVIEHNWRMFRFRLWLMQRSGLIQEKRVKHSIFPRMDAMPCFSITDAGRAALREREPK